MEKETKIIYDEEKKRINELIKTVRIFADEFQKNVRVCDSRKSLFIKMEQAREYLNKYCKDADAIIEQIQINDELI